MLETKYNTYKTQLENKIPDTSDLVKKTNYNTKITELENKIFDTNGFLKKCNCNIKITELGNKISDISNLATKTALITVKNKIPSIRDLVKKQTIILKLQRLKINLMIIIMTNILILQSLIN